MRETGARVFRRALRPKTTSRSLCLEAQGFCCYLLCGKCQSVSSLSAGDNQIAENTHLCPSVCLLSCREIIDDAATTAAQSGGEERRTGREAAALIGNGCGQNKAPRLFVLKMEGKDARESQSVRRRETAKSLANEGRGEPERGGRDREEAEGRDRERAEGRDREKAEGRERPLADAGSEAERVRDQKTAAKTLFLEALGYCCVLAV